jgi:amino acid adenylation domain-containing protein/thioester reductase-like protein
MSKNNIEAIYPLSPLQEGLLFHTLYAPTSGTYFEQLDFTLLGRLNISAFKQAWQHVIDHHPILRTLFVWERRDKPLQVVRQQVALPWEQQDWRDAAPAGQQHRLERFLAADRAQGFDLGQAPLMRLSLLQMAEVNYHFIWSFHHLLLDGWSSSLVLKELFAAYEALSRGERPQARQSRPYRDYIIWLQQQDLARAEAFWRQTLQGFTTPTPLQVNRVHTNQLSLEHAYAEQQQHLPATTRAALQALARQQQVTLNTLIQAAWALLLSRYSGETDVIFGATLAGRPADLVGVEEMVGLFINTLPVRVQVNPHMPLLGWLKTLQSQQAEARQYDYAPLAQIQRWSELSPGQALFESLLVFENFPVNDADKTQHGDIAIGDIRFYEKTNYPLTLMVVPGAELWLQASYNSHYFEAETISRLLGHLQTLLEGMAAQPEAHLAELPLLTEAERQQILITWNDTYVDYPHQGLCLHQLFEQQVEQTPDAVAVVFEDQRLTYQELNRRANQLAHYLRRLGVGPEVRVGICMERSLEMVVSLYAILKAGGAYVPLDPTYPPERLAFMLQDAQTSILLTQERLAPTLPGHQAKVITLEAGWQTINQESTQNLTTGVTEQNLAYVIYTSGSTGQPKGAMNSHRAIRNRLLWMQEAYRLNRSDAVLQKTPFSFDVSVWEFFWPLLTGARLVVARPEGHKDPAYLVEVIVEQQITTLHFVPSMLQVFVEAEYLDRLRSLRRVICSGEALPYHLQERFFARLPEPVELHNLYGPTEAAVDVTYWACQRGSQQQTVPIGRPIANIQIYLLDPHMQPVPVGVPGELYIGGVGLARGYLNRPELTAEKFIPNPFNTHKKLRMTLAPARSAGENEELGIEIENTNLNQPDFSFLIFNSSLLYKTGDLARYLSDGNIEFLGRLDHQVKIRGFRIELGEIETTLAQHPGISEVVVIDQEDNPGDKRLVAYFVAAQESGPDSQELRTLLKAKLPEYMIPAAFVRLAAIPLTPNGKLNRWVLPAPDAGRPNLEKNYVAPRSDVEKLLANIWADVLKIERVGLYDDFFELGGHSLLATQLIFRIREAFQVELPLRYLFESANIAGLAQVLTHIRQGTAEAALHSTARLDLNQEATLDAAIQPGLLPPRPVTEAGTIFLTGATGFLGAFLLYELLHQTGATIHCLVRAADIEAGRQRVQKQLGAYLLWDPAFNSRIVPVIGDLAQPYLGLARDQFRALAGQLDLIYHNGASINFVYPYHKLRPTNVLGTQEVLRLAAQDHAIPIHYISTISIFDSLAYFNHNKQTVIAENEELRHGEDLLTGYAQSKWVAEKLVLAARARGLPISIYRPGVVAGDSRTGAWNTDDFTCRFIKGCIQLGYTYDLDEMLQLTPVDFASKAIVYLSQQPGSQGQIFHLLTPYRVHQHQVDDWLRAAGYSLEQLSYQQWRETLIQVTSRSPEHALYPLLPLFIERVPNTEGLTVPELFTQDREPHYNRQNLARGLAGTDIICPPIDAELFSVYLSYFIRTGFLPAPARR